MLALANSVCRLLIVLSSGMYKRESTAKHGTARHSRAQHGTARRARHRTALRRAVELAELKKPGGGDFVLSDIRSWMPGVTRKQT